MTDNTAPMFNAQDIISAYTRAQELPTACW